jgi:hypothetical protein
VLAVDLAQPALRVTADTFASDIFFHAPTEGTYALEADTGDAWGTQMELWLTPWGFLEGAAQNGAEAVSQMMDGDTYSIVTWTAPVTSPGGPPYVVTGYINSDGLVERVETRVENSLAGDMLVENLYSDYQEVDGVMVPMSFEQRRSGGALSGAEFTSADANPGNIAELVPPPPPPAEGGGGGGGRGGGGRGGAGGGRGGAGAPAELSRQLGDGV